MSFHGGRLSFHGGRWSFHGGRWSFHGGVFRYRAEVRKRTSCDAVVVFNVVVIVAVVVSAGAHTMSLRVDNACIQSASSSCTNQLVPFGPSRH